MKENKTLFVPASRKIYRPKALGTSGGFTSWIVVVCMSLSITLFSAIAWNSYDALRDVKMEKLYVQNMYGAEKGLVWGLEKARQVPPDQWNSLYSIPNEDGYSITVKAQRADTNEYDIMSDCLSLDTHVLVGVRGRVKVTVTPDGKKSISLLWVQMT